MRKNIRNEILADFDRKRSVYSSLAEMVSGLLQNLLLDEGVVLHAANYRCKDRHSLEGKLGRPGKSYACLEDITDIAGIRLTTYFADDVDRVAEILRRELEIDDLSSIDKRLTSDPDRFGYSSLHYIAKLSEERIQLREYSRYKGIVFEIQIRSILQHAWAEIEHDLGYKSASGIPADVRRRFARISGLLELADSEFCAIREQLNSYEQRLPEVIRTNPESAVIDLPTLRVLVDSDPDMALLDSTVISEVGGFIESGDSGVLSGDVDRLRLLGINTVDELKVAAKDNIENVRKFSSYWVKDSLGEVGRGIGVFYLCYVLVWKKGDVDFAYLYLNEAGIEIYEDRRSIAQEIMGFSPDSVRWRGLEGE